MAEAITVARPYAEAVFKLAKEQRELDRWSAMLALMETVAADSTMRALTGNPAVSAREVESLFLAVCGDGLDGAGRNLVQVLVENRRLGVVAEIRRVFEQLKAEHESVVEAKIYSAFPLSEEQLKLLTGRLEAKYQRRVTARVAVDPQLIGGVRVVVGDQVLDATVRGQLEAMAAALSR
ncbi:MAG: F0F1 ATP synthase subunit delta [Betaproteobacteria bacterium]|nr:F0F1 ATP synthase subunit delta [Betaproteobacteria bacterium]MBI3936687.1 F0F1 ATP synthase subunit delta [Betaproteobacteria bacterium]